MRTRLVPEGLVLRAVLLWGALGLVAGAAAGALVNLETRAPAPGDVVYHGRYVLQSGVTMSRAYESTLTITFTQRHPELMLLTGLAIGLLAGLVVGLALAGPTPIRRASPSGRARR